MKRTVYLVLLVGILSNSCCKQEYGYEYDSAYEWVKEFRSHSYHLENESGERLLVSKEYVVETAIYSPGDEECDVTQPFRYALYTIGNSDLELLHVEAFRIHVSFYPFLNTLGEYNRLLLIDGRSDTFSLTTGTAVAVTDTIIADSSYKLLRLSIESDDISANFKDLKYVKGLGIVEFTDLNGINWK